jgi:serine/threonine-protein kinase
LEWLMDAPPLPMSWQEAGELVASLNREFGGEEAAWRVPTVEELLTLLQPRFRPEDLCLPPILGGQRRRLWSSDERTCSAAWLVDAENGAVLWQDKACRFRILPVRARRGSDG